MPLASLGFPLGPFQQDSVGRHVPNNPETDGQPVQRGVHCLTSRQPPNGLAPLTVTRSSTGQNPAGILTTKRGEFLLTVGWSMFRFFLHGGKHLWPLVLCLKVLTRFFSSRNQHIWGLICCNDMEIVRRRRPLKGVKRAQRSQA